MGYRWFNVDIEVNEDGEVEVLFEGRVEFPHGERVTLEPGDKLRVHGEMNIGESLVEQPKNVSWYMKNSAENEVVARGGDE